MNNILGFGRTLGLAFATLAMTAAAEAEPVKVALIEALSGQAAASGKMYLDAIKYSVDQANKSGGVSGRPIELMVFDNTGSSSTASDRFREATSQGAQIILQAGSSSIAGQLSEDVRRYNTRNPTTPALFLTLGAEASELTGAKCNFYTFRLAASASMRINALLDVMSSRKSLGTRIYAVNQNYSYGTDGEAAIDAGSKKFGYDVVGKILHDFGRVQDFAPYVAKIREANPDTVITTDWSTDLLLLMKSASDTGLKARFATTYLDYPGSLASLGDLAEGHYVAGTYNLELEKPEIAESFKAATGRYPIYHADLHTVSMMNFLFNGLKTLGPGQGVDVKKLAYILEDTSVSDALGVTSMRKDDHQAIIPIVVAVVGTGAKYPADGTKYAFIPIATIAGEKAIYTPQSSCKMVRPD